MHGGVSDEARMNGNTLISVRPSEIQAEHDPNLLQPFARPRCSQDNGGALLDTSFAKSEVLSKEQLLKDQDCGCGCGDRKGMQWVQR